MRNDAPIVSLHFYTFLCEMMVGSRSESVSYPRQWSTCRATERFSDVSATTYNLRFFVTQNICTKKKRKFIEKQAKREKEREKGKKKLRKKCV